MTSAPAWEFTPVLSDWSKRRIDRLTDLRQVLGATNPAAELPTLTREQLVASADQPRLVDAVDLEWWNELDDAERAAVVAGGQRSLIAAGHLRVAPDSSLEMSPQLQLVVAVRSAPAFLALAGQEQEDGMVMRAYGFVPPSGGPGVLVEARILPGVNRYLLATRAEGAASLARFLLFPPREGDPFALEVPGVGRVLRRRLEVLAPGQLVDGRRFEVLAREGQCAVAEVDDEGVAAQPRAISHADLADLIESGWSQDSP